jgi:DNA primase
MGRIAEESIQQVIATVNIVDVIQSYFPLKRAGTTYKTCCPFHTEKTPSFSVSPARNTFHCFGCGKGGNAIRFVMDYENLPFVDTVRKLAQKYGITLIEEAGTPESEERTALRVKLLSLHRDIAEWFHQMLLRSPQAEEARAYLKKRGLNSGVARNWLIGYAPAEPGNYRQWAQQKGYRESLLVQGGIYSPREEGNPDRGGYPRFKHRVMFPIRNDHGDVIAFSGRILDADSSPAKYMNSPATPIFSKSEVFFGLDKSKRAIHKAQSAIICEGQIDMISCFEHGIENIIAPLGTAFTPEHARLLKRHTEQVTLCFDADNAGYKAAQSCFAELSKEGIYVKVATLPKGDDPDSLIRREGVEAMRARVDEARDFLDWQIELRLGGVNPDSLRDRMRLLSDISGSIARLRDRMAQDAAINRAAIRLAAPVDELRRMVAAHAKQMLRTQEQSAERAAAAPAEDRSDAEPLLSINHPALRQLLKLALTCPEGRMWLAGQHAKPWLQLSGGQALEKVLRATFQADKPESMVAWLSTLAAEEEMLLTSILHDQTKVSGRNDAERAFFSLQAEDISRELGILKAKQKQPGLPTQESLAVMQEIMRLQEQYLDLLKKVRDIPQDR